MRVALRDARAGEGHALCEDAQASEGTHHSSGHEPHPCTKRRAALESLFELVPRAPPPNTSFVGCRSRECRASASWGASPGRSLFTKTARAPELIVVFVVTSSPNDLPPYPIDPPPPPTPYSLPQNLGGESTGYSSKLLKPLNGWPTVHPSVKWGQGCKKFTAGEEFASCYPGVKLTGEAGEACKVTGSANVNTNCQSHTHTQCLIPPCKTSVTSTSQAHG